MSFDFLLEIIISTTVSFMFLGILFWPMEKLFPANPLQKTFRPEWFLDLCFFLGQYILWSGLVTYAVSFFGDFLPVLIPERLHNWIANQNLMLQIVEVILLSDFLIYWGHRLQHQVNFLWRFHKIHHTSEHLDWLAAHREHPLDSVYTILIINLPALILGFPLESIAGVIAFRGIWAIYIHSNVRLPIGPLKMIIGSPELHHWHHEIDRKAGNYANISPLMDLLFGTYSCPDHEPEQLGISEKSPKSYLGMMIFPFYRRKRLTEAKR